MVKNFRSSCCLGWEFVMIFNVMINCIVSAREKGILFRNNIQLHGEVYTPALQIELFVLVRRQEDEEVTLKLK